MKNFTKQNFKTNPLWIRLLIMTFMLLAGTSSAWAGYAQGYFYYDNSVTQYSSCYIYIGHNSWSDGTQKMSLVSGTRYLYSYNFSSKWDGATNWFICAQSKNGNSTSISNAWNTAKGYSKKPTDIYGIGNNENAYNIGKIVWADKLSSNYYSWSSDSKRHHITSSTTCKITLNIVGSGSVTVKNNAGTALISNATTSTSKSSVQYLTYLKNITATAADGYKLSSIKIGSTDYTSVYQSGSDTNNGYDLTGDVTITVTFEEVCTDPSNIKFTVTSPKNTYYLGDKVAATLSYDGTEVDEGHSWTYDNTAIGISGPAPTKGASFTFTLKKVTNSTDIKINLPKCSSGTVASTALNFAITALPNPTAQSASISGTTASLSWTKNTTYTTVMVVRYAKGATVTAPTQGTAYTAGSSKIGNGTVVYKGTETSYSNTGLTAGSSYDYYFYTVNNNYYSAGVKATAEGCTPANVTISNLSSTTLCTGGSLTFDYTAAAGANVTFKMGTNPSHFTINGDGSNSGTVTIKYNSSTTINNNPIKYDVSGTDICALTGQSTGKTINCGPKPSIDATSGTSFSFCPGDAAVTLSVTADKGTYSWAKNDSVIAGKTSNSIEVSEAGTYTVFVVGTGGCESNTVTFTVNGNGGPVIKATDAEFNKNNFADFAALYVTDCSGKEIESYQWYKDGVEYSSICNYSIVEKNKTTKVNEYKTVASDAGKTNNIRPNAAGNYTCKATYKDGSSATSAAFVVTATDGTTKADFNSNLPVIMVNTGSKDFPSCPVSGETASKNADKMKKKLSVDVKILHDGEIVYDRKARMAYRGSSSLNFLKKSYAFCPGDANCGDADKGPDYVKTAKLNMLDIGEACDKDWVLYAAAADPSMLRNRMVFETYQAMRAGDWGVHSRYVELIINGEYKGVYVMMDKITQNEKRVNVKWDVDDATKRGFILKFDKTDIPDRSVDYPDGDEKTFLSKYSGKYDITTYDAQVDQAFEIEYPEKEDIQDDGGNWYEVVNFIKGKINDFETALAAGDYATVQQIIDYESWADWFILSEYTKNVDAFRASCVFVYDGNKIKATPLWDQELSFNNQSPHANRYPGDKDNKGCQDAIGLLVKHEKVYTDGFAAPFWFTGQLAGGKGTEKLATKTFTGALLNDQCFVQMVKNRWEAHKSGALSKASLTALITEYEKELTSDVRTRAANFWSSNGYSRNTLSCPWGGNSTGYYDDDYATAKGHITNWISDNNATNTGTGRRKGLDAAISALEGTGLDISISPASIETTPWVPVVVQVKNESGYEYTLTYTDGSLDQVKDLIIERSGDTYKYHIPRPAAWGTGNEAVEGEREDISYGIKATLQIGDANNQCGTSGELPSATATIILQDEDNDDCYNN